MTSNDAYGAGSYMLFRVSLPIGRGSSPKMTSNFEAIALSGFLDGCSALLDQIISNLWCKLLRYLDVGFWTKFRIVRLSSSASP